MTLEERVDQLERTIAGLGGGGDSSSPDVGQTIGPDGSVSFDFTGHIHAQGLDLDAGVNATPPDVDRIRWLRTSDGAVIAALYTYESFGAADTFSLDVTHPAGGFSHIEVSAVDGTLSPDRNEIIVSCSDGGLNHGLVSILDALQQSSFVQLNGTRQDVEVFGPYLTPSVAIAAGTNTSDDIAVPGISAFAPSLDNRVVWANENGNDTIMVSHGWPGGDTLRIFRRNVTAINGAASETNVAVIAWAG